MAKRKPLRAARAARPARSGRDSSVRTSGSRAVSKHRLLRRQEPETLRLRAIEPSLTVNDLERSLRFYSDVLGFMVSGRYTDSNGALRGVMLKAGACGLGLSQDDWSKGRDRKKGEGMSLWLKTAQDVDTLARRIAAAGGRLADGPKTEEWGGRSLSIDDPDGFRLRIYAEK
jgi:uncharacterized glyoxalase superfamily protein PhnB